MLQKANDYIDFLQHKIARLCLDLGIEHKIQDGRMCFSVPFNTILGKGNLSEVKIAISTHAFDAFKFDSCHAVAKNCGYKLMGTFQPVN